MAETVTVSETVNPGTAQRLLRLIAQYAHDVSVDLGMPVTTERRPFLSSREPRLEEKIRTDVKLKAVQDSSGVPCLLYSIAPKDGGVLRLPVRIASVATPYEFACTTDGRTDKSYERFEGVVRTSDGAIIPQAVTEQGEVDLMSLTHNRVSKSFVDMTLRVAASKLAT